MRALIAAMALVLCLADIATAGPRITRNGALHVTHARATIHRPRISRRTAYDPPATYDGGRSRSSYRSASHPPYPTSYRRR